MDVFQSAEKIATGFHLWFIFFLVSRNFGQEVIVVVVDAVGRSGMTRLLASINLLFILAAVKSASNNYSVSFQFCFLILYVINERNRWTMRELHADCDVLDERRNQRRRLLGSFLANDVLRPSGDAQWRRHDPVDSRTPVRLWRYAVHPGQLARRVDRQSGPRWM